MTDLNQALPNRKIRIRKTGVWPGVFFYLGALMLLGVAGFIGVWQAPGVVNDWLVASDPVAVPDATITDGECHARRVVFVDCSAHVAYEIEGKSVEHDIDLMFVNFHTGDYEVDVVRSASQPNRAALSLGLDMLWNRTLVDSALVLGIAAAGIGLFAGGAKSDRSRRLARRNPRWIFEKSKWPKSTRSWAASMCSSNMAPTARASRCWRCRALVGRKSPIGSTGTAEWRWRRCRKGQACRYCSTRSSSGLMPRCRRLRRLRRD
ncbi:hypothetical protein U8P80_26620 (plasmid) [Rhizobium beringeri]|nr:hypothetical protein U8P80_26620 [Rhizobium beringeri]WSH17450.1 hypothetical protein U8P74_26620 [Rhizobium beringeri]